MTCWTGFRRYALTRGTADAPLTSRCCFCCINSIKWGSDVVVPQGQLTAHAW